RGSSRPDRMASTYDVTRRTPWESWPTRLFSTSEAATWAALVSGAPAAVRIWESTGTSASRVIRIMGYRLLACASCELWRVAADSSTGPGRCHAEALGDGLM